ncbi:MAG: hypothetical protein Fur0015_09920 [Ignavibacteriales bacterium]
MTFSAVSLFAQEVVNKGKISGYMLEIIFIILNGMKGLIL